MKILCEALLANKDYLTGLDFLFVFDPFAALGWSGQQVPGS
ncbi:hypothetical protein [Flavobacterium silvaticum]|nr:hypothetical protein [Flavobacterium silvaticum]